MLGIAFIYFFGEKIININKEFKNIYIYIRLQLLAISQSKPDINPASQSQRQSFNCTLIQSVSHTAEYIIYWSARLQQPSRKSQSEKAPKCLVEQTFSQPVSQPTKSASSANIATGFQRTRERKQQT